MAKNKNKSTTSSPVSCNNVSQQIILSLFTISTSASTFLSGIISYRFWLSTCSSSSSSANSSWYDTKHNMKAEGMTLSENIKYSSMIQQLQLYFSRTQTYHFSHKLFCLKINLGRKKVYGNGRRSKGLSFVNCQVPLCKNDIRSKALHCIQ